MRTMPTDMIELTRKEGDALWWACDAFFDHCTKLLESDDSELDSDLLAAIVWANVNPGFSFCRLSSFRMVEY